MSLTFVCIWRRRGDAISNHLSKDALSACVTETDKRTENVNVRVYVERKVFYNADIINEFQPSLDSIIE